MLCVTIIILYNIVFIYKHFNVLNVFGGKCNALSYIIFENNKILVYPEMDHSVGIYKYNN